MAELSSEYSSETNRIKKWNKYFTDERGKGPELLLCILARNAGWRNANDVATRLSGIYGLISDRFHATSHELHNKKDDVVVQLTMHSGMQIVNAMTCISGVLEFQVSVHDSKKVF
jgi:hypothetical protein